ncbi:MAG: winged helix-turn-helix domain-containing protein [Anaerolineae bacterium]|nr:MAG: winged helix-turn-helix domain-containing protein [Anaerolineae bacterium]
MGSRPRIPSDPKQCDLITVFMHHPNEIITRQTLMEVVWDTSYLGDTRTLDVHIHWLRQMLRTVDVLPPLLQTIRGQGYRLNASDPTPEVQAQTQQKPAGLAPRIFMSDCYSQTVKPFGCTPCCTDSSGATCGAALLWCMTPLAAALSSALMAARRATCASCALPLLMAVRAFLAYVRVDVMIRRLRVGAGIAADPLQC